MTDGHKRVLITGATGFLGSRLLERCVEAGWSVRAVSRDPPPSGSDMVEWLRKDVSDPNLDWDDLVAGVDVAFHLAWSTVPYSANQDPASNIAQNLPPGLRLAAALVRQGAGRLLFFSSGGTVYGVPTEDRIGEDHRTQPTSFYGEGKLAMERHLDLFHALQGLDRIVLRVSNPFGPGQRLDRNFGAIVTFAQRALRDEQIVVWGDGRIVRDYLYVDDVIDAALLAAASDVSPGVYNIGSGEGRTLNQILDSLGRLVEHPLKVRYEPPRAYDVPVNVLDIGRARRDLRWAPQTPFDLALRLTVEAMRAAGGR